MTTEETEIDDVEMPNTDTSEEPSTNEEVDIESKSYDLSNTSELISLYQDQKDNKAKVQFEFSIHIKKIIKKYNLENYKIIFLYDDHFSISPYHSNQIYEALHETEQGKNILLILLSDGGKIEPAYLISKTANRLKNKKFVVSIPRRAKSAATLISLGADEIHMGLLSELGPIDPQIAGFPALGLSNALEKLAVLATQYPKASDMLAKYLSQSLLLRDLGYLERVNESAAQYAERLLSGKSLPNSHTPESLAYHLTNHYKDHSFVIDIDEANDLFGPDIIKVNSPEYNFANEIFAFLNFADFISSLFNHQSLRYIGSIEKGLVFDNKKED